VTPYLSIRGVAKRYGEVVAVAEVSLDIAQGEFVTFLGPSGSGKSTLLYMIAGIEDASAGDILLQDGSLLAIPPHKRNIGMVFQRYTLVPHMSVEENVAFPLKVRHWSREKVEQRVAEVLGLVRLDGFRKRRPAELSGGQQQRVALARALAYHPRMLLMDEPLAALDKKLKEELQVEIRRIHQETGVTIIYVTHDQEEALRLSQRIAVFNHGRIEQADTPARLYEAPASRFVAGFVGNCNFLSVRLASVRPGETAVRFPDGSTFAGVRLHGAMAEGEAGGLLLRPEQLAVRPAREGGAGLAATVVSVTYLGEILDIACVTAWGEEVAARVPIAAGRDAALVAGMAVTISWPEGHGIVFEGAAAG